MNRNFRKLAIAIIAILIAFTYCDDLQQSDTLNQARSNKKILQSTSKNQQGSLIEVEYTENIEQFKSKKYNERLESLIGCWLMSKQYLDTHKPNYLFFKDSQIKSKVSLKLVKQCMKKINRKNAILKITELVGKNIQPAKKYQDIVSKSIIDTIFNQLSKLKIADYHEYQPSKEILDTFEVQNHNKDSKLNIANQSSGEILNTKDSGANNSQQESNQLKSLFIKMSQFDSFLLQLLEKYSKQFQDLNNSKQGLKAKVQQELKKRQKYYFGFIPATSFTHSVMLISFALSMVFCCTCYKYYKLRLKQDDKRKLKEKGKAGSHEKQLKKMSKMTQLTFKKKMK